MTIRISTFVAIMAFLSSFHANADCSGPLRFYAVVEYNTGSKTEIKHIIASTYNLSTNEGLHHPNNRRSTNTSKFSESETTSLKKFIKQFIKNQLKNKDKSTQNFSFVDGYTLTLPSTDDYSGVRLRLIDTEHTQLMTASDVDRINRFLYFDYNEFAYPAVVNPGTMNFIKNETPYRVRELRYDFGRKIALDYIQQGKRKTTELTYESGCL